jgi:hypothetical protein
MYKANTARHFRSYEERRGVFVFGHLFIVVLGVMIHLYLVPAYKPVPNIGLACGDAKGKKSCLGRLSLQRGHHNERVCAQN